MDRRDDDDGGGGDALLSGPPLPARRPPFVPSPSLLPVSLPPSLLSLCSPLTRCPARLRGCAFLFVQGWRRRTRGGRGSSGGAWRSTRPRGSAAAACSAALPAPAHAATATTAAARRSPPSATCRRPATPSRPSGARSRRPTHASTSAAGRAGGPSTSSSTASASRCQQASSATTHRSGPSSVPWPYVGTGGQRRTRGARCSYRVRGRGGRAHTHAGRSPATTTARTGAPSAGVTGSLKSRCRPPLAAKRTFDRQQHPARAQLRES